MNKLEEAAALIEGGWCVGNLVNGDGKYCSVGAILAVNGVSDHELRNDFVGDEYVEGCLTAYQFAETLPEIEVLAKEIIEADPESYPNHMLRNDAGYAVDVVYNWNDCQTDINDVLEMFKLAAKRLD